jgi:hypothetical protein
MIGAESGGQIEEAESRREMGRILRGEIRGAGGDLGGGGRTEKELMGNAAEVCLVSPKFLNLMCCLLSFFLSHFNIFFFWMICLGVR